MIAQEVSTVLGAHGVTVGRVWENTTTIGSPCTATRNVIYGIPVRYTSTVDFSLPLELRNGITVNGQPIDLLEISKRSSLPVLSANAPPIVDERDVASASLDPIIDINVAGHWFQTRRSTVAPLRYFATVLKWDQALQRTQMLDRDPAVFSLILKFLRSALPLAAFEESLPKFDAMLLKAELNWFQWSEEDKTVQN